MQANRDDLEVLLQMQETDTSILRLEKELVALPQRKTIVAAREKKRSIEEKQGKVANLKKSAEEKLTRVGDEDSSLADKQRSAQAAIDGAHGNYRNVEARSKEMNGYAKRRATLEGELDKLELELSKIEAVEAQVKEAFDAVVHQETEAVASFQAQGGALKNEIARLQAQRTQLASRLPKSLLDVYESTAAHTGGVAVARLLDGKCGTCRAVIEGGRLLDLKAQAPLGICPACKRLIIV